LKVEHHAIRVFQNIPMAHVEWVGNLEYENYFKTPYLQAPCQKHIRITMGLITFG
jgi:hypothetical protein